MRRNDKLNDLIKVCIYFNDLKVYIKKDCKCLKLEVKTELNE